MKKQEIIIKILQRRKKRIEAKTDKPFDPSSIGDMAFLLLIFFIVTGSFIVRQGILFSLPDKNSATIKMENNQIIEIMPENDGFIYNGKLINRKSFKDILISQKAKNSKSVLVIQMRTDVKYDRLVDTLSVAKETGMNKISLKNLVDTI